MRFVNKQIAPINFTAGKVAYTVPPGCEVDLPDRFAFVVPRRGVLLVCLEQDRLRELLEVSAPKPAPKEDDNAPIVENDEGEAVEGTPWGGPLDDGPGPAEMTDAVEATLNQLAAQGIEVPGAKRRKRRSKE